MRNRHLYPKDWKHISLRCRELAGWVCEECGIAQGAERTSRRGNIYHVALSACHRDHTARKLEDAALVCLCERCHWWHDFRLWQLDEWRKLEQAKHRRLIAQAVKIGRVAPVAFLATPAQAGAALAYQ